MLDLAVVRHPGQAAVTDNQPIEVGVKFRSEVAGWITGIRFYKGAANTGTHVGHLWASDGTPLGSATFSSETASGWQQVDFAAPVAIAANTTYIASYHSEGYFAIDSGYFTSTGVDAPPLHALQAGVDGPNGVYRYGASGFPVGGSAANYWVDVAFATEIDTTPPTITGHTPLSNATNVATTTGVTATFDEPMDAATIDQTSFTLRASGAGFDVPATVTYAGTTATLDPIVDLAPFTTYDVTVAGSVADVSGNPLGSPATWSFTTGATTLSLIDTTVADFGAGSTGANTYVSDTAGGEVILAPTVGAEFNGTELPGGWSAKQPPWVTGGTATVAGGSLSIDGTMAGTTATFGPGHSLEFVATFSAQPFQHVGFVADLDFNDPWAIVSTGNAGSGVFARTSSNPGGVSLGTGLLGSPHRYRIDWTAGGFDFSVDGTLVTTIPFATSGPMLVGASDAILGTPLVVDWIHMTPYPASGTFTSRVLDAGAPADWGTLDATSLTPTGTGIAFEVRAGDTPTPDGSWSGFVSVADGADIPGTSRYLQYRAVLTSTDGLLTPTVYSVTVAFQEVPETPAAPPKNDFDGDGKSDILWRNTGNGQNYVWFMDGATRTSSDPTQQLSDQTWQVKGTGDFDGDGKSDIVWRNTGTGQVYVWLMNGTTASSQFVGTLASPDWTIVGTGDFDGDGKSDILWRNTNNGQNYVWFMDGATRTSSDPTQQLSDQTWQVKGTGDFDGDGKSDIVWRNTGTGQVYVWLMNGTTASSQFVGTLSDPDWTIVGTGDFDGDGKSDILWRNTGNGQNYVWFMDGATRTSSDPTQQLSDQTWEVRGTGDFDGDGKSDILWRNTGTGQVYVWLMNGTTASSQPVGTLSDPAWVIVGYDG